MKKDKTKQTNATISNKSSISLKASFIRVYNLIMFVSCGIATYVLWFNGNTLLLQVLAVVLAIDAAVHAYKLVAVKN